MLLLVTGILIIGFSDLPAAQRTTALITFLTAWLWLTEILPIPAASLLPLSVFPLLGILTPEQIASAYGNPLILLMLGGFIISQALSASHTHRYLAQHLLHKVGADRPRRLILGLILAAAGLSMWISNTATALMLLPIALAATETSQSPRLTIAALLAVAYGASIGGILTPIGTPPNLLLLETLRQHDLSVNFLQWMGWTAPIALSMGLVVYRFLTRKLPNQQHIRLPATEPPDSRQKRILAVFAVTAMLWMFRNQPFGGWSQMVGLPYASDANIALLAAFSLFALPDARGQKLLRWEEAQNIPWGVLLLFAAGISIAKAFSASGLSETLASQLEALNGLPVIAIIAVLCLAVTFATEINSNTATTAIILPILLASAKGLDVPYLLLLLPATISASFAFMMPVATPPNAIVFSSGKVPIQAMMKTGVMLNLIGVAVITIVTAIFWRHGSLSAI